ncbi:Uncharacterised protein [Mycobacteroides abscessus subsp. bolletii]|nr:Uncharacterised protein [Mycobacteroides abscessus subsp. bolletii]SKS85041.1 Uncharacterised protein [Mycobacteroides abscessus subsp. bolletii]
MIGQAAKLWAEAIESVIDSEFDVLTKADAAQRRQDAAEAPTAPKSSRCTTPPTTSVPRPCWC